MIDADELRGLISKRRLSQRKVAKSIGITQETFYRKMKSGDFRRSEIDKMIDLLEIEDPERIFFAKEVT